MNALPTTKASLLDPRPHASPRRGGGEGISGWSCIQEGVPNLRDAHFFLCYILYYELHSRASKKSLQIQLHRPLLLLLLLLPCYYRKHVRSTNSGSSSSVTCFLVPIMQGLYLVMLLLPAAISFIFPASGRQQSVRF